MTESFGIRLEISVETVTGARVAAASGADRIELCGGLDVGGLTPSMALTERVLELVGNTEVHVLIRPRPGDFQYAKDETSLMCRDIELVRATGVTGVVVGALTGSGAVATADCAAFIDAAAGMQTTFHRAFDVTDEPERALENVIELGFTRLLTSGQQTTALAGAGLISTLVRKAGRRLDIMACGGVRAGNARTVLDETGVRDLHAAVRAPVPSVAAAGTAVSYASPGAPTGCDRFDTDPAEVTALRSLTRSYSR